MCFCWDIVLVFVNVPNGKAQKNILRKLGTPLTRQTDNKNHPTAPAVSAVDATKCHWTGGRRKHS